MVHVRCAVGLSSSLVTFPRCQCHIAASRVSSSSTLYGSLGCSCGNSCSYSKTPSKHPKGHPSIACPYPTLSTPREASKTSHPGNYGSNTQGDKQTNIVSLGNPEDVLDQTINVHPGSSPSPFFSCFSPNLVQRQRTVSFITTLSYGGGGSLSASGRKSVLEKPFENPCPHRTF